MLSFTPPISAHGPLPVNVGPLGGFQHSANFGIAMSEFTTTAKRPRLIETGRRYFIAAAVVLLAFEALVVLSTSLVLGLPTLIAGSGRMLLTAGWIYLINRGYQWARWSFVALLIFGIGGILLRGGSLLMLVIYGGVAFALGGMSSVAAFLKEQRHRSKRRRSSQAVEVAR